MPQHTGGAGGVRKMSQRRCLSLFLCLPHLWRKTMFIRHILKAHLKVHNAFRCPNDAHVILCFFGYHEKLVSIPGPSLCRNIWVMFNRKVWIKLRISIFFPNTSNFLSIKNPFSTYKHLFVICGEWQLSWTTLS